MRDLRDYIQRIAGAQATLSPLALAAKSGIFAGTYTQFPLFKSQKSEAPIALWSSDPEAFVVEVQGDRLYLLGKSECGVIAAIYTFLDRLECMGLRVHAGGL